MLSYFKYFVIIIAIYGCSSPFGEYINHKDLETIGKNFSDIYFNRQSINEFRTDGYYYRIDSVRVYQMIIMGDTVYRFKFVIDDYSKNPNWRRNKIILDEYTAYYFNYFWIKSNGLCYIPSIYGSGGDFENVNCFVPKTSANIENIKDTIFDRIDLYWKNQFSQISNSKSFKGASRKTNNKYDIYYFMGQMELPHSVEKFTIYPITNQKLKVVVPLHYSDYNGYRLIDSTFYFDFHPTTYIPKDREIGF